MLYDCWLQIVASRQTEMALLDLGSGRRWTFNQLAEEAQSGTSHSGVRYPSGGSAEFIFEVLRGWRMGQVVCPLEPGQPHPELGPELPRHAVHLKSTSASTGKPRAVVFTGRQLKADADNIVTTMGLRSEWPNLGVISLAHSYGFSNLVLPLLLHGVPLILVPSALPEALRQAAQSVPEITIAAVPTLWRAWLDSRTIPTNLRLAISAGAPLPLDLETAALRESGVKIHNFYGSSECGGIAYDAGVDARTNPACVGAPLRNVDVSISEDGCVEVRGAAVGETYWPEPSPTLQNGFFRSADLGEISSGLIYLKGRASDQINVAGRKVLPELIERVLASHPQVRMCLVFGVPSADVRRGEVIVACIARAENLTVEAVKQYAMSHLPAWQVPREWWFVDSLEANLRGKISRAEWRKRYFERARSV